MSHTTDQGLGGVFCKNCGRPSHCGVPFMEEYRRQPYNHGIEGMIKVCSHCNCDRCNEQVL